MSWSINFIADGAAAAKAQIAAQPSISTGAAGAIGEMIDACALPPNCVLLVNSSGHVGMGSCNHTTTVGYQTLVTSPPPQMASPPPPQDTPA